MLRKRSRTVTSKQAISGDHNNQQWLPAPEKPTKPTSFFFNSPRILKGFFTISYENEPTMSPTSILDTKPFSALTNTFWSEKKPNPNPNPNPKTFSWEQPNNTKGIGIALVDNAESNNLSSKQNQKRKLVVFGSQLKIQVSPSSSSVFPCSSSSCSPESPKEFGIKTPRSNMKQSEETPDEIESENISMVDMEQSEDYTCVISHGPNPKTTHIFGNCIVESGCGVDGCSSSSSRRNGFFGFSQENFLSFCYHCKKELQQGEDIYMYRGDKAFCSEECRSQEMLFDGLD